MQYLDLPQWARYLTEGIIVFIMLASSAVILGRAGRSPWLALVLVVPFALIPALWVFAFTPWPKGQKNG